VALVAKLPTQFASSRIGSPDFGCRPTLDVQQGATQGNLQLEFPPAALPASGRSPEKLQAFLELGDSFSPCRAGDRLLAGPVPVVDCLLGEPCLRAVVGEQFGLALGCFRKLLLQNLCDTGVQRLAAGFEQRTVGGVLNQRVFET
jgi:hypothetical protein